MGYRRPSKNVWLHIYVTQHHISLKRINKLSNASLLLRICPCYWQPVAKIIRIITKHSKCPRIIQKWSPSGFSAVRKYAISTHPNELAENSTLFGKCKSFIYSKCNNWTASYNIFKLVFLLIRANMSKFPIDCIIFMYQILAK